MISNKQIIEYKLDRNSLAIIYQDAKLACLGGKSHVRNGDDRQDSLIIDQMVGLIGNYAGAIWRDGDARAYLDQRHAQNRLASVGDGGYDLPRCRIDFKSSMMRYSQDPSTYNLLVRPQERKAGWIYVCVLVSKFDLDSLKEKAELLVYMTGWLHDRQLPKDVEKSGPFQGAHVVSVMNLQPLIPFYYEYSYQVKDETINC